MENLKFLEEIKQKKDLTLENIVRIFMDNKISRYDAFNLISTNFKFPSSAIIHHIYMVYANTEINPFNKDFFNLLEEDIEDVDSDIVDL